MFFRFSRDLIRQLIVLVLPRHAQRNDHKAPAAALAKNSSAARKDSATL